MWKTWANAFFVVVHALVIGAGIVFVLFVLVHALPGLPTAAQKWDDILRTLAHWPLLLRNTVGVCGIAVAVAVGLAIPLAILAFRTDLRGRYAVIAVLLLGTCTPLYVSSTLLVSLVDLSRCRGSVIAAGLVYGVILTAPGSLLIGIGLRGVNASCEEAALLDASVGRVLRSISLPMANWSIAMAAVLVVFVSATDYFVTDMLQVRTFAEEVYTQYALAGTAGGPILASLPMVALFAGALTLVYVRRRPGSASEPGSTAFRRVLFSLGRWRGLCSAMVFGVLLLIAGLVWSPVANQIGSFAGFVEGCRVVGDELFTSAWTGCVGAFACAGLSIGIAWTMVRSGWQRWVAHAFVIGLLALPAPVVGITLVEIMNRPGLGGFIYDSPVMLVLAYVARFLPLAVLFVLPAVERVPIALEESARLEGARLFDVHRFVCWPLCWRDVRLAWFFLLAFSFGEVPCSVLVAPPGHITVGVRFFTLIHYGFYRDAAVICLLTVLTIMIPWLFLTCIERFLHEDSQ